MIKKIFKIIGREILEQILEKFKKLIISKILVARIDVLSREKLIDAINSIDVNDFVKNV